MVSLVPTIVMVVMLVVVLTSTQMVKADPQNYKQGFKAGYHDGLNFVFRQNKIHFDQSTQKWTPWSRGYIDGWHKSCEKTGLDMSPGGGCDESMDVGKP